MTSVFETTVASGFCCGCGVCAGICPKNAIHMEWNSYGEYNPTAVGECFECGVCVMVCPFADGNKNEDEIGKQYYSQIPGIHHLPETGYYLNVFAGAVRSEKHRLHSASGGLATWFLQTILSEKIVDAVICVEHSEDGKRLFKFTVARTSDEIYSAAGSVYYPVEISEVLKYIHETPGKYAIIGLPCLLKGLRLAQNSSKIFQERIVMLIGLACANQKSTFFTSYAAWRAGVKGGLLRVDFRKKKPEQRIAKFFTFSFLDETGNNYSESWAGELSAMYQNKCFTLHSCDCCDDIFAECADVCFMDAWLPEYICEPRGTSVWITRSNEADEIIQKGVSSGDLSVQNVSLDDVIAGQAAVRWKREILGYRLHLMQEAGEILPLKRVEIHDGQSLSLLERKRCKKALILQRDGRKVCAKCNGDYSEVHEWFTEVWKDEKWFFFRWRFVSGRWNLMRMGCQYLISLVRDKK